MEAIDLQVKAVRNEGRIDSRLIAPDLGILHPTLIKTIRKYQKELEQFGQVFFKNSVGNRPQGGGNPEKYALLNENQSVFLMTLSRNTPQVVALKARLVAAFSRFREHQQLETDYLPFYHSLHDEIKALASAAHQAGSTTPEQMFHINFNRLLCTTFGLHSVERGAVPMGVRPYVTAANLLLQRTVHEAVITELDHKAAYALAKLRLTDYVRSLNCPQLPDQAA